MTSDSGLLDGVLRRTVLKTGAIATGALALSTPVTAHDDEDDNDEEEVDVDEVDVDEVDRGEEEHNEVDLDEFTQQLLEVQAASRPYWRDVALAREDGFDGVVSPYEPGMGFHFVNPALLLENEDAEANLSEPAILVYVPTEGYDPAPGDIHDPARDDELVAAAVEFAHTGTEGASANLFADDDADHPPRVPEDEGWHFVEAADVTALHVWVPHWNPAGVFSPTNPAYE